ncbi:MAG: hypothetical protein UX87_C0009G0035 [Candidatus Amesbacteria bacterium GW2011_GWA1_47_16]|uniref:Uncharacterized protein n=1 Tax=Candidatus Amesbacteria bacterium GW2011_GWA1_47_16 TaxID=1618353 RepID=A0A0G1UDZ9_9BACT|nr:MAG: hypothetical protein UX87_C0009G0035 [Candidatus Amesbacteria bacterium GW2011_GWA1_47_16]
MLREVLAFEGIVRTFFTLGVRFNKHTRHKIIFMSVV